MKDTYKYKAFISYSHQDQKFAKWLHKKIENYKIPKSLRIKYPNLPKNLKRTIFLDEEELPIASALPDNLSRALESSELLIVICSPNATKSYWVDKEIVYFKQYHGSSRVLAMLKDGEPNATHNSAYRNDQEAFPRALRYQIAKNGDFTDKQIEPLAADGRSRKNRKKALIKLIAGILKVNFADLWKREKRETRKRQIISISMFTVFAALMMYSAFQYAGEKGNKELEEIKHKIAMIEYHIRHDNLSRDKAITLNKELKKLKIDEENKKASQEALGKLKTSLGKKAQKFYQREGARSAITILTSEEASADQESRLKDLSKEKLALAKLYIETYEFDKAKESFRRATEIFFDYENGSTYGNFMEKQNYLQEAIDVYNKVLQEKISIDQKVIILNRLSVTCYNAGQFKKAEVAFKEAIKITRLLAQKDPDTYNPDLSNALSGLTMLYRKTNQFKKAGETSEEALKLTYTLAQKSPDTYRPNLAIILNAFTSSFEDVDRLKRAEKSFGKLLEITQLQAQEDPDTYNPNLAIMLNASAILYQETRRPEEAEETYIKALGLYRGLVKKNPDAYSQGLVMTLSGLAILYYKTKKFKKAEETFDEKLKISRVLAQGDPDTYNPSLASTLTTIAVLYQKAGALKKAEATLDEALKITRILAQGNPDTYNPNLAITLGSLASVSLKSKKFKKAEKTYREASRVYRVLTQKSPDMYNPSIALVLNNLGLLCYKTKQPKKAEDAYMEALKIYRLLAQKNPDRHSEGLAVILNNLASLFEATNRPKEAKKIDLTVQKIKAGKIRSLNKEDLVFAGQK